MSETNRIVQFFEAEASAMKVTVDWIRNPTTEGVLKMYYFMCDLVYDIESLDLPSDRDVHESMGRATMIKRVFEFLTVLLRDILPEAVEFTYSDLLLPQEPRTRYFLLQLIDFYRFKNERQQELDDINNQLERQRRDVDDARRFEQTSVETLAREREALEQTRKTKFDLTARVNAKQRELSGLQEKSDHLKKEISLLNERDREIRQKINELEQLIREPQEKNKRLDMNIVSSPQRIRDDLASMERELTELDTRETKAAQEYHRLEREKNNHASARKIVDNLESERKILEEQRNRLAESSRQREEKLKELRKIEERVRLMQQAKEEQEQQGQAKTRTLNDKLKTDKSNAELYQQERAALESDLKELGIRRAKAKEEFRNGQADFKDKEKAFAALGEKFDHRVESLEELEQQIVEKVKDEEDAVQRAFEAAKKALR